MQQSGEHRIGAPMATVWRALNDPDVLCRCIEGCQSMERVADNAFKAAVKARVGPVSALFTADVTLTDVDPPHAYTLQGAVKGGPAGFGKGTARVRLSEADGGTLLSYDVEGSVGGKLAQVGQRLIDGAARKMADDFFARFSEAVAPAAAPSAEPEVPAEVAPAIAAPPGQPLWPLLWLAAAAGAVVLVFAIVLLSR